MFNGKVNGDQIEFTFGTDDGAWGTTVTVKREGAAGASATEPGTSAPAAATAAPAATPDISGFWKGDFEFNGNSMPITFNFQQKDAAVTGNLTGMGAAPIEIHDGKVDGSTVSFWINSDYQGQTYTLKYTGKISPGQIDFSFGTSDGSWGATVTAKKSPPPPALPEK